MAELFLLAATTVAAFYFTTKAIAKTLEVSPNE
jgi:hypothetical protein